MSNGTIERAPVIRQIDLGGETASQRLVRKHLPAWVLSGAVHVLLVAVLIWINNNTMFGAQAAAPSDTEITIVTDDRDQEEKPLDLTNPDLGIDPDLPAVAMNDYELDVNVDLKVASSENPGIDEAQSTVKVDIIPPAGIGTPDPINPGLVGETGNVLQGLGSGADGVLANLGYLGRGAATRSKLVAVGGGNSASEAAVALGLLWLSRQQKANGSWVFDGTSRQDVIAATGMSLLPFLGAGQTHKSSKDNKYNKNVDAGLRFLIGNQRKDGSFTGSSGMYAHAIATVALCEALGMSGDRGMLQLAAQRAVNYIIAAQGNDGSWGYSANQTGDTSIVGWQVQALHSAKLCKELVVDQRALIRARKFLDKVASGSNMSQYGYRTKGGTPTLTSIGLLCRYYMDGWGPNHPGMAAGVAYLLKSWTPNPKRVDMYYYYYATQVLHFYEGPEWHKDWNPKMRDLLVNSQVPRTKGNLAGSWDPGDDPWIGGHCGRLGQTCMSLLTLEVYYRHLPLYKRDTGGLREMERAR